MPWDEVMDKWKAGSLRSGGSGRPVTNQKQAVAIMLSEKRAAGAGKAEYQSRGTRMAALHVGKCGRRSGNHTK